MDFHIEPFIAVGPIPFGATRSQVRKILGVPVESFKRNDDDPAETDEFDSLGVFVEYDKDDLCIAVEMSVPANPVFRSRELLREPYAQLRTWIKSLDSSADVDEAGIDSSTLGVGLYADLPKRDRISPAESAIAFKRGYYDE